MEWDIQRSREGIPVVFHDETLDRTTNGEGPIQDRPLEELQKLDAGSWFGADFAGEPIPSLRQVLERVGHRATRLYPEIKRGASPDEVDRIFEEVVRLKLVSRTVFISMDWDALDRIRGHDATSARGYIVEAPERYRTAIDHVKDDPAALLDPDYRIVLAMPEVTSRARDLGIDLAVWTVDDPDHATALARVGVTRFTTNQVQRLLDWAARKVGPDESTR